MNKIFNWGIALLLPGLVCCGSSKKVQDVPEEIYACPMPGEPWSDEPEEDSGIKSQESGIKTDTVVMNDTTTNKIN